MQLYVSESVLAEVADVLQRPEIRRRRPHVTPAFTRAFTERIRRTATLVDPVPEQFSYPRDPNDEPYLNLAIATGARYLVSRDHDLLDLQHPESEPGRQLRTLAPELVILDPLELLRLIDPEPDEDAW